MRLQAVANIVKICWLKDLLPQLTDATIDKVIAILGRATYAIVGWCEVDVGDLKLRAIVVSQQWPEGLPFGTDPWKLKKAQKFAAIYARGDALDVIEVVDVEKAARSPGAPSAPPGECDPLAGVLAASTKEADGER